jgi:hypothetical protein
MSPSSVYWRIDPHPSCAARERGSGDLGRAAQASLVCKYFTGRNVIVKVFWYAPNTSWVEMSVPSSLARGE